MFVRPPMCPPAATAVERDRLGSAIHRIDAKSALVHMGWKPAIASAAVEATIACVGSGAEIAEVIRQALRRCPRATA